MAIRTNYELIDILTDDKDFSISATDLNNVTRVITSTDNTLQYFKHKYGTRQYSVLRGVSPATKEEAYNDFSLDFRAWVSNRQHNIDKLYQSMFDYSYSPIENVDRYENETINKDISTEYGKTETLTGTDTTTYGKTDNRTINGTLAKTGQEEIVKGGSEIHEIEKAGFNSPNTYTNDTKDTQTFNSRADETSYSSTDTNSTTDRNVTSGSDSLSKSETNRLGGEDTTSDDTIRTLRVHGNIGVTSNVDLLEQEERYRLQSLAELLLDNFINDYTFYC